jgi:hypothetical protein
MLSEKDRRLLSVYERQLQVPKWRFIILNGLLWGILVLVFMSAVEYFFRKKTFTEQWNDDLPTRLIIMPIAGLFYGWIMRRIAQRKYQQLKQQENTN